MKYFTLLLFAALASCNTSEKKTTAVDTKLLEQFNPIIGQWTNTTEGGVYFEEWSKQSDSLLTGSAYFLAGTDTAFSEKLKIAVQNDSVFYIPVVKGQNEGKPVLFRLVSSSNETFVFENPNHDFPTKITYRLVGKDSLYAEVSGSQGGQERVESFPMRRK